jgi:serpin B
VLLPGAVDGLPGLEQRLTAEKLRAWLERLDGAVAHRTGVLLPRFTTRRKYDLVKTLRLLGVTSLFNGDADLSGMDGTQVLFVSDAVHEAFVEVNEEGTEAAAATTVHVSTKSMNDRFIVNHPFLFLIRDSASGSILFLGRIVDPRERSE